MRTAKPERLRRLFSIRGRMHSTQSQSWSGQSAGLADLEFCEQRLKLSWHDGHVSTFPLRWLVDHSPQHYNTTTGQRTVDTCTIPQKLHAQAYLQQDTLEVEWTNNTSGSSASQDSPYEKSVFELSWLREHCLSEAGRAGRLEPQPPHPVLWGSELFARGKATLQHKDLQGEDGVLSLMRVLKTYGIALVRGTTPTMEGTEEFARRIGAIRQTLYGGMWATNAEETEVAHSDSAYTNDALGLHTDCAYMTDPPGLQVFNCMAAAPHGGESLYADGFAIADRLQRESPEAFDFLSTRPLRYVCKDVGYLLEAAGPVFLLGPANNVVQFRHNDYDRATLDHFSCEDVEAFYAHHQKLSEIIRDPNMVASIKLLEGDMIIASNQRTLHGRAAFSGRRRMVGCYVDRDELESQQRVQGLPSRPYTWHTCSSSPSNGM
ncbi:unnamed protein product [Chrysoparadoxa australica]